jgi:hypothetical protein
MNWASYPSLKSYPEYHAESRAIGDVDPSYSMLRYICDRFELNTEQRYWLAYIYSTCYCGATTFYIYNEFPDWENVDFNRADRWWKANRDKVVFQTDRRWVRSRNQWVDMLRSYSAAVRPLTQEGYLRQFEVPHDPFTTYKIVSDEASKWFQMGRFGLWLYTEAVHVVTGFPMEPRTMKMRDAESCRNGLVMALGMPEFNTHGNGKRLSQRDMGYLQACFQDVVDELREQQPGSNVWNIETTLCAYKKYHLGKRWPGYYIDRQADEIRSAQTNVTDGVDWSVLWDYRRETFRPDLLCENRVA